MRSLRSLSKWTTRFILLYILFIALFLSGTLPLTGVLDPDGFSEPGLVSPASGLLILSFTHVSVITALILTSRWHGWKLAATLALAYYGAVTFLTQIETWYFLSSITVDARILPRLFVMGLPTAFVFVPAAVWVLGRGAPRTYGEPEHRRGMSPGQWAVKLAVLILVYVALYWTAGYYIAWQNPELRAFYGRPGTAMPFINHTLMTLRSEPSLFLFQSLRAVLWVLCALPVLYGSRVNAWPTAVLVGLLFSAPQNVGHILANPLMPAASVRLSHMIETASSTFLFGMIVVWLLHRNHSSAGDLIGLRPAVHSSPSPARAGMPPQ